MDNVNLAYRFWAGESGRCVVLYLHGIEGHSQWFENTASVLNHAGITVYASDRRGSGLNSFERGHTVSFKSLLADAEVLLARIRDRHRNEPIVLMGNCWGAKAAVLLASQNYRSIYDSRSLPFAGLVLTCPAIKTKVDFDLKTKLKIAYQSWRRPGAGHDELEDSFGDVYAD